MEKYFAIWYHVILYSFSLNIKKKHLVFNNNFHNDLLLTTPSLDYSTYIKLVSSLNQLVFFQLEFNT